MGSLPREVRLKGDLIANALLEEGYDEGTAIRISREDCHRSETSGLRHPVAAYGWMLVGATLSRSADSVMTKDPAHCLPAHLDLFLFLELLSQVMIIKPRYFPRANSTSRLLNSLILELVFTGPASVAALTLLLTPDIIPSLQLTALFY